MTRLSVNINKVATIRNARGGNTPDLIKIALDCEKFGAQGITVHPRPDERHIRKNDVFELKKVLTSEFNIEGYPSEEFLRLIEMIEPTQVTLVPDPPDALTSNAGWNTIDNQNFLQRTVERLHAIPVRVSIFADPEPDMICAAKQTGADRIELYTEAYARKYASDKAVAIGPYIKAAEAARNAGMKINAGHDLSLENLRFFVSEIPHIDEVSIGHALISDALYFGLEKTISLYLEQLR
jgi:pyridoxine 5-phosphate synthase